MARDIVRDGGSSCYITFTGTYPHGYKHYPAWKQLTSKNKNKTYQNKKKSSVVSLEKYVAALQKQILKLRGGGRERKKLHPHQWYARVSATRICWWNAIILHDEGGASSFSRCLPLPADHQAPLIKACFGSDDLYIRRLRMDTHTHTQRRTHSHRASDYSNTHNLSSCTPLVHFFPHSHANIYA